MTSTQHSTQSLEIVVTPRAPRGMLITVSGELDAFSIKHLAEQINDMLHQPGPSTIELNLAAVEFIDAAAADRLRRLHRLAADVGCVLSIAAATQFAWWLFASVGLASIFPPPAKHRWASEPGS